MTDTTTSLPDDKDKHDKLAEPMFRGLKIADLIQRAEPPVNTPISRDEWSALSADERRDVLLWFGAAEKENTEGLTDFTLPRIKYPTSGSSFWEVPGADKIRPLAQLRAVVLKKAECRVFYPPTADGSATAAGTPPSCMSADCVKPDPEAPQPQAETCGDCPWSKWDSGKGGQGQACKKRIRVYMDMENEQKQLEDIPMFTSLPPSAIRPFSDFVMALTRQGGALEHFVLEFGLEKRKNRAGTHEFSGLTVKTGRPLTFTEARKVRELKKVYGELMQWRGGKQLIEDIKADAEAGVGHDGGDPGDILGA